MTQKDFPGTIESPSSMVLDIVCQVGESGVLNGTNGSTGASGGKLTDASYESSLGFGLTITGAHSLAVASAGELFSFLPLSQISQQPIQPGSQEPVRD